MTTDPRLRSMIIVVVICVVIQHGYKGNFSFLTRKQKFIFCNYAKLIY